MPKLFFDFETRSAVDLRSSGGFRYASDKTTTILCLSWAIGNGPVQLWWPGESIPKQLRDHVADGQECFAFNAQFDHLIWENIAVGLGFPTMAIDQVHDLMAMGLAMGLPAKLDVVAKALGLSEKKDMTGQSLMRRLSRPRGLKRDGSPIWVQATSQELEQLGKYAKQDTIVARLLHGFLLPLTAKEREVWLLDQKINLTGMLVDLDVVAKAENMVEQEKYLLDTKMAKLTGGQVATCNSTKALVKYVADAGVACTSVAVSGDLNL
jgi:DNA polymerase bacteriophage-type